MRDETRAKQLAHALVGTGNSCGIRTRALLTDMNQPLGRAVGHAVEVQECLNLLRGKIDDGARPVLDLSIELSAHMLVLSRVDESLDAARARLQRALDSGAALERFRQNVEAQGGEPRVCDDPDRFLPLARESVKVESPRSGFVRSVNTTEVGHAIAAIGGGRIRVEDSIDPSVNQRMSFKFLMLAGLLCVLALAGPACHRQVYSADDKSKIHVGIVFDIGGKDDRSFNAAAFAGVKCAETGKWPHGENCGKPALDIVLRDIEPGNPTSIEPAMRAFAERGYDLVIGVGFAQAPIMEMVAKDYPSLHFAIIDGVIFEDDGKTPRANVASLIFKSTKGHISLAYLRPRRLRRELLAFWAAWILV